ncbi:MAG: Na+/H+ antiporter subunit E [Opitutaceae bacterium]|nr:Na+/H+ antiporter subunit E [Opitutaceae bacterium]
MRSLVLNVLVAVIWLLLQTQPTLLDFFVGAALGFLLLFLFRPVLHSGDYVRRVIAANVFVLLFAWEFLRACVQLIRLTLFVPVDRLRPDFLIYDVSGLTRLEILLLSHCVSLTPGTCTVDISHDFSRLYLHVLDCPDPAAVRRDIDNTLRRGILAFTR